MTHVSCLHQLMAGESSALRELYHAHRSDFFAFVQKKINVSPSEIADIYQDAMVIFFLNLQKGKIQELPNGAMPYIIGIAKNLLLRRKHAAAREISFDPADESFIHMLDFPQEHAEEPLEHAERLFIRERLTKLSENCLLIIKMFYYQNITIEKITQKMGYSSDEVTRVTKMRCIQKLRDMFAASGNKSFIEL
ncbi:MAG: sigma-70 family RNA polymerase sigma factor [Saprospiraceae bacterium]|nr:sigma-70 family RNA polymerase sigma factor [Saprospiraceae bacterium]